MTICIGAIAERDRAIIMVADRALTVNAVQATNSGQGKIFYLGPQWYALASGRLTFARNVISAIRSKLTKDKSICDSEVSMQSCLETSFQECRRSAIEDSILKPQLLTAELLTSRPKSLLPLNDAHYRSAIDSVLRYHAQTSLLVCGFDKSGQPHILELHEPGVCASFDSIGYHAIGIGQDAARVRLASMETDRKNPLATSLYGVFDAKVGTEIIQGISYEWDAEILVKGKNKAKKVPSSLIKILDNVYRAFPRSPFDITFTEPKNWWTKLDTFAKTVFPSTRTPPRICVAEKAKK